MSTKDQEKETIVDVKEVYSKTERYVEENKTRLMVVIGAIVLIFIGYFAYTRLYLEPKNQEGNELLWKAEYYFQIDSLDKAIHGDESYFGFAYVADNYQGTKAGDLANYYLGVIALKQGDFELAIDYLKDADLEDEVVGAMAKGGVGDAYVELGDYNKALDYYEKAISHSSNGLTAPMFLMKAGLIHEELGNFDKALKNYKKIKEEYPGSTEAGNIDYYIGRIGG